MRLVTWNAGRGKFAKKAPLLEEFGADISVIPEIAKPEFENERCLWFGTNPNQGIAVTASQTYSLTPLPEKPRAPRYVIPIQVEWENPFYTYKIRNCFNNERSPKFE